MNENNSFNHKSTYCLSFVLDCRMFEKTKNKNIFTDGPLGQRIVVHRRYPSHGMDVKYELLRKKKK